MRIGIDTRFLHLGLTHSDRVNMLGGIAGYLYYLVTYLLKMDCHNTYVLFLDKKRPIYPFRNLVRGCNNVEFLSICSPFQIPLIDASFGAVVRLIQDRFHKIPTVERACLDLLHSQDEGLALQGSKAKQIVTIHAFLARRASHSGIPGRLWDRKMACLKQADRLIAISECLRRDIIDYLSISPDRVITVHHGYDSRLFRPIADGAFVASSLANYGIQPGYILFVGGLTPEKNIPNLLRAFRVAVSKYKINMPLLLCGVMFRFFKREFIKMQGLIRDLGLHKVVQTIPYMSHNELPIFYNGARVVVSPSLSEGFGLVPLEAMACGTPVVVSNRPAIPEVVADAGYYVDPEDVEQIAQAIYEVAKNSELRAQMQCRGLERATAFSWEKTVHKTWQLYMDTLGIYAR